MSFYDSPWRPIGRAPVRPHPFGVRPARYVEAPEPPAAARAPQPVPTRDSDFYGAYDRPARPVTARPVAAPTVAETTSAWPENRELPIDEEAPRSRPLAASESETLRKALDDLAASEARVKRDAQRVSDETRAKLVGDLLPVVDNLDRTLAASRASSDRALVQGVEMVRTQLEGVLARYGVERVDARGERFDPRLHEAISMREVDDEEVGHVVDQAEAGYRFGGKLMRPAKVVVGASRS